MLLNSISENLFEIGAIQTGHFTLKSGLESPIYVDLRNLISFPDLLDQIVIELTHLIAPLEFDLICGVPYTGIPLATLLSQKIRKPMLLKRKEIKTHGLKRMVEGRYEPKQKVLIIEDIVTSGLSILETIKALEDIDLQVNDAICLIDREQGGKAHLLKQGYHLHSLTSLNRILDQLEKNSKIQGTKVDAIKAYLKKNAYHET